MISSELSAVVTGGASGLGRSVASALAESGVKVAIFDIVPDGKAVAAEIGGSFHPVDVSDPDAVAAAFIAARRIHGQERICINCAGIAPAHKTVTRGTAHDAALFAKVISVNLIGSFNVASQSAAGMTTAEPLNPDGERGVIINTASVAATDGQIGQVAYGASKGGVAALTLPMARDLAQHGIRIMAIAPGIFKTPMLMSFPQEVQDALGAQVPFPSRLGSAQEFASLALHIIDNPMLNGGVIRLDGAIRMPPK